MEIVDHGTCAGAGRLRALTRDELAPLCPRAGAKVRWQLTHAAPTVASDHLGAARCPDRRRDSRPSDLVLTPL